ncbi:MULTISPECIES: sigma factor-like helix-turn-helix DNA-binding protein [unclassified Luteibacter]|uniref:sigma factor-like helix-turn-helix DNA-binding protein n=1 Tax=unclassified Luteibacter TaxID=2620188 RepID=UPI0008C30E00|nr:MULTISPECIES: sigma factor-like helix-turn-helix DNA-binding protein [unclassified Luteibacter]SEO75730.1 Sigma-70, region 4 [Luteibacter sp. UNC138MFCol5.1]SEV96150.1 Sigma-70, region 4 [Luteibacter sp. 329MFSha]
MGVTTVLRNGNQSEASQIDRLLRLIDMDPMHSTYERLRRELASRQPEPAVWLGLLDALDRLPADARLALLLSDVFEASIDDVAALLHRDAAACRRLVDEAHERIHAAAATRK